MNRVTCIVHNIFQKYAIKLKKDRKTEISYVPQEKKPIKQTKTENQIWGFTISSFSSFHPIRILFLTLSPLAEPCISKIRQLYFLR